MSKVTFKSHRKKITADTRKQLSAAVRKTAFLIEADAKVHCPVDTGALRASIQTAVVDDLSAAVGTNQEYAAFVEFGTVNQAAQPYFTPAVERGTQYFEAEVRKVA